MNENITNIVFVYFILDMYSIFRIEITNRLICISENNIAQDILFILLLVYKFIHNVSRETLL